MGRDMDGHGRIGGYRHPFEAIPVYGRAGRACTFQEIEASFHAPKLECD